MPVLHWLQPLAALGLWHETTSMRIAVLCSPGSWYLRDLQRAGGDRHEVSACAFGQIVARLGDVAGATAGCAEIDLARFDGLMVRSMPPGSLEQVVFRMDVLARVERSGLVVLNPPRGLEIAIDKYLALARLGDAGLRIPPTVTCQGREAAMEAFRDLGRDVVIKPLFGGEGRGIARVNDEALALRAFSMLEQMGAAIYLQRFLPHHGFDVRLLVVGDRVLAMRRRNPDDWRTNVSLGATTEPIDVDEELTRIARCAADAVGTPLAGVDLLPARDGHVYVLEVNAVPGWKALARTLQLDVARLVLEQLERLVESGGAGKA